MEKEVESHLANTQQITKPLEGGLGPCYISEG